MTEQKNEDEIFENLPSLESAIKKADKVTPIDESDFEEMVRKIAQVHLDAYNAAVRSYNEYLIDSQSGQYVLTFYKTGDMKYFYKREKKKFGFKK